MDSTNRQPRLDRDSLLRQFRDAAAMAWRPGRADLGFVVEFEAGQPIALTMTEASTILRVS